MDKGIKEAFFIFCQIGKKIPAYKKFFSDNRVSFDDIKSVKDWQKIPCLNKKNYLSKYHFIDLFPDRVIPNTISASSGSSGVPFYWPRGEEQEEEGSIIHEKIFSEIFKIGKKRVLVMVCFSMGSWVAGTYTATTCAKISKVRHDISVITPGIDKDDAVSSLKRLAPLFDKVIITGYPPFVIDVLSEAQRVGVKLKKMDISLLFAGESFSEQWRGIVHEMIGKKDYLFSSVNIYGSADACILGHETPLTIFLRRQALKNKRLAVDLFGAYRSNGFNLVQYYPEYKYFEEVDGKLVFTAKSGLPLIRYMIGDNGRVLSYEKILLIIKKHHLHDKIIKLGLNKWKLPGVVLQGREDVAASFYALNIYSENIKAGLENRKVRDMVTGKFTIKIKVVNNGKTQIFNIYVELKKGISGNQERKQAIFKSLFDQLVKLNTEYRKLHASIGNKALPNIKLLKYGSVCFRNRGPKHKWVV